MFKVDSKSQFIREEQTALSTSVGRSGLLQLFSQKQTQPWARPLDVHGFGENQEGHLFKKKKLPVGHAGQVVSTPVGMCMVRCPWWISTKGLWVSRYQEDNSTVMPWTIHDTYVVYNVRSQWIEEIYVVCLFLPPKNKEFKHRGPTANFEHWLQKVGPI